MASDKTENATKEPLIVPARPRPPVSSNCSWPIIIGFLILTFNSGMAIQRSRNDKSSIAFIVVSYVDLVLLFLCLDQYERAQRGSSRRTHLKTAVWCLSTILTLMFSYKVANLMPFGVKIVVWAMAVSTIGAGFYLFFMFREGDLAEASGDDVIEKPAKLACGP